MRSVRLVTVVVRDYDEALRFYVDAIGFEVREDTALPGGKRWVVVGPPGGTALLLARAATDAQRSRVGDQTGGRVAFFLDTDDFTADYERLGAAGVRFVEPPRPEVYGQVAVFEDLYGNRWDLVERRRATGAARAPGQRPTGGLPDGAAPPEGAGAAGAGGSRMALRPRRGPAPPGRGVRGAKPPGK